MSVAGRLVIIAGATSSSGVAAARELMGAGARVIAVGRDPHKLAALAELGAQTVECDLTDESAVAELARARAQCRRPGRRRASPGWRVARRRRPRRAERRGLPVFGGVIHRASPREPRVRRGPARLRSGSARGGVLNRRRAPASRRRELCRGEGGHRGMGARRGPGVRQGCPRRGATGLGGVGHLSREEPRWPRE